MTDKVLNLRPLWVEDATALCAMLAAQSQTYTRFFTPFRFDQATIAALLVAQNRDVWIGMFWLEQLAGFFMLRGWDAGFAVPSYGVLIDEQFSGYGLARLSLQMAKSICRLRRTPRIMLKVHPENLAAKILFEQAKFICTGRDAASGNLIYHFDINERAAKS